MIRKSKRTVEGFKKWLSDCGAEVLPATSEWEVVRVATCDGVLVAYQNKAGEQTWPKQLTVHWDSFVAGQHPRLAVNPKKRRKARGIMGRLSKRDGWSCWFCGVDLPSPEDECSPGLSPTLEHLLPVAHGGSNHISNLCLAHHDCNVQADKMAIVEKVALREKLRAEAT